MLLHPVAIAAVLVLVINDHVVKQAFPGFVTGKVSDIAGLVFFPLLLAELAALLIRRDAGRLLPASAAMTTVGFALVKLTPAGAFANAWGLGAAQWIGGLALPGDVDLQPVVVVMDPTDLLALPAVLLAVAVGRRDRGPFWPARQRMRFPDSRVAPAVMAVFMAAATMATAPPPAAPTGVVVTEQIGVSDGEIAVRHLTWAVAKPSNASTRVRLEVSTRAGSDKDPASSASPIRLANGGSDWFEPIRIVPDDPGIASSVTHDGFDYEFTTVTLDLTSPCRAGCRGGARIFINGMTALVVMRLTTGFSSDDASLTLKADGANDYTGSVGQVDSGEQEAQIELDHVRLRWHGGYTVHVAAEALQAPIGNLRLLLRTRVGGVDNKAGMGADATLGIATTTMPIDLGGAAHWHDIDLSSWCTAGSPCDIPLQLDVVAGPPSPAYIPGVSPLPSPTLGHGVDVYRWSVQVAVQAFDGRQLPADGVSIAPTLP